MHMTLRMLNIWKLTQCTKPFHTCMFWNFISNRESRSNIQSSLLKASESEWELEGRLYTCHGSCHLAHTAQSTQDHQLLLKRHDREESCTNRPVNPLSTRPHQNVVWYNNSWLGFLKIMNYVPKKERKYCKKWALICHS